MGCLLSLFAKLILRSSSFGLSLVETSWAVNAGVNSRSLSIESTFYGDMLFVWTISGYEKFTEVRMSSAVLSVAYEKLLVLKGF